MNHFTANQIVWRVPQRPSATSDVEPVTILRRTRWMWAIASSQGWKGAVPESDLFATETAAKEELARRAG